MENSLTRRSLLTGAGASALLLGETEVLVAAPPRKLPRARPEAEGMNPAGILAFVEAVEAKKLGLHSLMLLRHGKVLAEGWWSPYAPQHPHMLYSLSKSFTSTAVGLVVSEGKLALGDKVLSFFPDERPKNPDANLAVMEVRHLLMMGTGHDKDTTGAALSQPDGDWARGFLSLPVEHAPGSKFVYNTAATYMLSAIVQKVTGKTVLEYLRPRLFEPLGIANPTWETCPKGRSTGGFGLAITTEDIAKFGQLYLQKGQWEGRQLIAERWITEATSPQIVNGDPAAPSDWTQGYGYQFWRCRHGVYRGDGAFGQFCIVLPQYDAVVALTSGSNDLQGIVNAVWEHLLPAYQSSKVAPSPALASRLKALALPVPEGQTGSLVAKQVRGKTYKFTPNPQKIESVRLTDSQVILRMDQKEIRLSYQSAGWVRGEAALGSYPSTRVTTRGVWTSPDTLVVTSCAYETPYLHTLTCQFTGNTVSLTLKINVTFSPIASPTLTGTTG